MRRIFRAFLWMRWRVLINSLERTGSRDTLERFSVAVEKLGPIMAMILLIPSSIALFVLGITAGFGIATGSMLMPLEVLRYLTFLVIALTLLGPIVLPTRDGGSVTRLLLLPIPRIALYMAQVAGALADPWIALLAPTALRRRDRPGRRASARPARSWRWRPARRSCCSFSASPRSPRR